jgi:hypothetical protein
MKKIYFSFIFILFTLLLAGQEQKKWLLEEDIIGNTFFDVQTTRSMQSRIHYFNDGTVGVAYNIMNNFPPYNDFGIGYNYYDGTSWDPYPTQSITSGIALNPSYSKFGPNGEIVVSEGENGLFINYRINKGSGDWQEIILSGPAGYGKLYSPQIVTTGTSNQTIHVLALRKDTIIDFEDADQNNNCKVLYSRSNDMGITWGILNHEFEFNADYFGFSELSIVWAEPKNNTLAFLAGDYYTDLILMKSSDAGDTWQKTFVWEHPVPFFEHNVTLIDNFWVNTGSQSLALDNDSKAHLAFSISSIFSDTIDWTGNYDWWADGIVYWNEDRPVFSNNPNALNPEYHPESELVIDYSLVGWSPDIDGNGILNFNWLTPYNSIYPTLGISTTPTITIDDNGYIIVVYSSVTETYDNGTANYRHLWSRLGMPGGSEWGSLFDLTGDLIHIFDECVYPELASTVDGFVHLVYQYDIDPGLCIEGGKDWPCENFISNMNIEIEYPSVYLTPNFYALTPLVHVGDTVLFYDTSQGYPDPNYFEWTFEGGTPSSSNLEDPVVQYNTQGTFDVTLYVSNGVMNQTLVKENYITVLPGLGVRENLNSDMILVSPNPTTGKILVILPDAMQSSIRIYNLLGKVVAEDENRPGEMRINLDLTGNNEGIYFLKISTGDKSSIQKVILNN